MYYVVWKDSSGVEHYAPVSDKGIALGLVMEKLSTGQWACL